MPEILLRVPWKHQTHIVSKCKTIQAALFYLNQVIEGNMSRSELEHIIDTNLYEHKAKALNNFGSTLPQPQGSLAEEIIKDPYKLDFISMEGKFNERDLENKLAANVTRFLLELRPYVKQSTMAAYVLILENHVLPEFGDNDSLPEHEVQAFVLKKIER